MIASLVRLDDGVKSVYFLENSAKVCINPAMNGCLLPKSLLLTRETAYSEDDGRRKFEWMVLYAAYPPEERRKGD